MLLKTLGKKKTESEYKKHIARVACSFLSLAILGLFIVRSNSLSDYTLGLVVRLPLEVMPYRFIILQRLGIRNVFIRCILLPMMSETNRFCRRQQLQL